VVWFVTHLGMINSNIELRRMAKRSFHFILFLSLISCLSRIDFPVDINGGRLVVSGQVSTLADQNKIELATTAYTDRLPVPLSGASIRLIDDETSASFQYRETESGIYTLAGISGIAGKIYHIEIKLANGKVYKSIPEKMPEASLLDSVNYEVVTEKIVDFEGVATQKEIYKIYANSTSLNKNTFVKWNVTEDYLLTPTYFPQPPNVIPPLPPPNCYIAQKVDGQRITLFDWAKSLSNNIKYQLIATREIDWTFLEKHYFTIYQSSITENAYDYWRKTNILANQVGSIFDTPPAELKGNLEAVGNPSEKVWGYFQAVNQTYIRKAFYQSDLPFPLLVEKCDFTGSYDQSTYDERCIDCTTVRKSSFKRPSWF
jgi:hypothetical protein